jgi:hypothetical protein
MPKHLFQNSTSRMITTVTAVTIDYHELLVCLYFHSFLLLLLIVVVVCDITATSHQLWWFMLSSTVVSSTELASVIAII